MHPILKLRGDFKTSPNPRAIPVVIFPENKSVELAHLRTLLQQLQELQQLWNSDRLPNIDPLITVIYTDVVAKSNRIRALFHNNSAANNQAVVGVRIVEQRSEITYLLSRAELNKAVHKLNLLIQDLQLAFPDCTHITRKEIDLIKSRQIQLEHTSLTLCQNLLVDALHVEQLYMSTRGAQTIELRGQEQLVSFYATSIPIREVYRKIFGGRSFPRVLNDTTLLLNEREIQEVLNTAPFLVAMSSWDVNSYEFVDLEQQLQGRITIPEPSDEPTIGVIDTQFSDDVYFANWVDNNNTITNYTPDSRTMLHGTAVTSIIVDGPAFNPQLEDGCGRFRVKFFGVAQGGKVSSYHLLKVIDQAVHENPEIKVWNISLGSNYEISDEFISPEAAFLDNLQSKTDAIFVVAATNNNTTQESYKIGAPADSLNSLVVGAVNSHDEPATYARRGNVLSFFIKPDVCYYGGDRHEPMFTCIATGLHRTLGTSYAAPWITRKLAYLIYNHQLDKESAKALLIDAAAGWQQLSSESDYKGYGVVPIHIQDIIQSPPDEIKFYLSHKANGYKSAIMNLPVPIQLNAQGQKVHNYLCKFTLCYFPECSRNQGIDYTNIEMDFHLGVVKEETVEIIDAFKNTQTHTAKLNLPEAQMRQRFRKWDNTKHQVESLLTPTQKKRRAKKALNQLGHWGVSVVYNPCITEPQYDPVRLGLVVTLKEIDGKDNYHHFIESCMLKGWIVTPLTHNIELFQQLTESISLE